MLRTLKNIFKQDKERIRVPEFVQDIIPVKAIYEDGLFLVGKNKYSKSYKFWDINYAVASREDKEAMFLEYSELLNSLDTGSTAKITINNRRINKLDYIIISHFDSDHVNGIKYLSPYLSSQTKLVMPFSYEYFYLPKNSPILEYMSMVMGIADDLSVKS